MEKIRTCIFKPYRTGPKFTLKMFDTFKSRDGKNVLAYELWQDKKLIFKGDDFNCSPMHAIDSDAAVATLMGFLCLRLGDTDREYFENYTTEQIEFRETHAEALGFEVMNRFGEV
jgi:hypothetical protein